MLDADAVALGMHRTGYGNWRIACENGFDNAHILVHKDNTIVHAMDWVLPLGILPAGDDCIEVVEDADGPKGMMQWLFTDKCSGRSCSSLPLGYWPIAWISRRAATTAP